MKTVEQIYNQTFHLEDLLTSAKTDTERQGYLDAIQTLYWFVPHGYMLPQDEYAKTDEQIEILQRREKELRKGWHPVLEATADSVKHVLAHTAKIAFLAWDEDDLSTYACCMTIISALLLILEDQEPKALISKVNDPDTNSIEMVEKICEYYEIPIPEPLKGENE